MTIIYVKYLHTTRFSMHTCNLDLGDSKGKFLYSAVSNPQDCSKRFTHYFPDRPVQSNTISTSLGSIQPYATINARRLLVHIHHLSIARYSFIQSSGLEQCRVKILAQGFNTAAQDSNPGPLRRESDALPLSHGAPFSMHTCNFDLGDTGVP